MTTRQTTTACYSAQVRCRIVKEPGSLAAVLTAIGEAGGQMGVIDLVDSDNKCTVRDLTVQAASAEHLEKIIQAIETVPSATVLNWHDQVFQHHQGGKIEIHNKMNLNSRDALSIAYTPGVARVCMAIHENRDRAHDLTIKKNTVAVVSDGTAVLGLGDIGPEAAMPVMEGKAMLFKKFGGVDAWPICLATKDVDEIVRTVELLAPGFGGINLEDISAPRCFEIEQRLIEKLDIPVFHDDQHGTAVVFMAALINSLKIVGKKVENLRAVVSGAGAAGMACTKIMYNFGVRQIAVLDRTGIIYKGRKDGMNASKQWFAEHTNPEGLKGGIAEAARGADLYLGVSGPGAFPLEALKTMAPDAIVFALSNPEPEIRPEVARPHVRIMGTGRSDFPNQINNVLGFPGIFRGALDVRATAINDEMKMAAARAIAGVIADDELDEECIIPTVFNDRIAVEVSRAVKEAALATGVARLKA